MPRSVVGPDRYHRRMRRRWFESLHLAGSGVWLGALVMTAVTAAVAFPTMKSLAPALPQFKVDPGQHGIIAAGHVMQRVFLACDLVQFICGLLCFVGIGGLLATTQAMRESRIAMLLRTISTAAALMLLSYHLLMLAPRMNENLRAYWDAALTGELAAADQFKTAFDGDHPTASRVLGATGFSVLLALLTGCWAATAPRREEGAVSHGA